MHPTAHHFQPQNPKRRGERPGAWRSAAPLLDHQAKGGIDVVSLAGEGGQHLLCLARGRRFPQGTTLVDDHGVGTQSEQARESSGAAYRLMHGPQASSRPVCPAWQGRFLAGIASQKGEAGLAQQGPPSGRDRGQQQRRPGRLGSQRQPAAAPEPRPVSTGSQGQKSNELRGRNRDGVLVPRLFLQQLQHIRPLVDEFSISFAIRLRSPLQG